MEESAEAYIKRILGDIPEFEERINSALNNKKGKSFHLKRAGSLLHYIEENLDSALSLIFRTEILERDNKGKIKKSRIRKKKK